MNHEEFNKQVSEFVFVMKQVPGIEFVWDKGMLKIYLLQDIEWEFRIVFSFAFESPVLYFRPRNLYMGLDQLLAYVVGVKEYVSQIECPITGEPFFFVHPCRSKELLENGNFGSWISVALQVVNARLPIEIFKMLSGS